LLEGPVSTLPGIGPAMAERLAERGIETVEDLLFFVPRRYDDARLTVPLDQAAGADEGARITCAGQVMACRFHRRGRTRWIDLRLGDTAVPEPGRQAAQLIIRWFNAHERMAAQFPRGSHMVVSGRILRRGLHAEMANPDVLSVTLPGGATTRSASPIIPRYSDVPGVAAARLRKALLVALDRAAPALTGAVPADVTARLCLVPLGEAIERLHRPPDSITTAQVQALSQGKSEWHRRLAFEDLFILGLAVARRRRARRLGHAVPCPVPAGQAEFLARALPFALTGAQGRAIAAIGDDLCRDVPMNRLLQGDVGSGKTAVAFAAAHQAVLGGRQVAFMAPTEILAEQHHATLSQWCQAHGVRCALLTSSTPAAARRAILRALEAEYLQLVVGTHALLSESVSFPALGLVIIDEQHRFGVAQRVELRGKGTGSAPGSPHLLVMTATPIPRTLALTAYGDLDVTIIDEMPPGRAPPQTLVLSGASGRERSHALVRQRLQAGERVFVVCPLIEQGDDDAGGADAVSTIERIRSTFTRARVGLVHGRMPQSERDDAMQRFRTGELDILVATTVIEVGVDVPEATVMVVLDAHRFGLAQLHQLRGRVGRGGGASYCLLMTRKNTTPEGTRRLAVMAETADGFRIAEEDLMIRGPGELLGVRQAGLPKLRFGDLAEHAELLIEARRAADALLDADPELARPENATTRRILDMRTHGIEIYGAESG
jgi:ATP-dependent DNA helicase RecG